MLIGILDLGTNTFNIFIAEVLPDRTFKKVYKSKISVKLGEGGIGKNHIDEIPFKRGINALKQHKRTLDEHGVTKIYAFATSAIRSSDNGPEFVKEALKRTGIEIQVISGEREAELIYYGVKAAVRLGKEPVLIMDIGGGSTEFILANHQQIIWKHSFQLGAARLIEKFKPSDPIQPSEITTIEKYLEDQLTPLFKALTESNCKSPVLIGSSGSFDSLAEMIAYRFYSIEILKGQTEYTFNMDDLARIHELIIRSTTKERMEIPGLTKMRVDMIVISTLFVNYIIRRLNIRQLQLSRYSLKEGALWELIHAP